MIGRRACADAGELGGRADGPAMGAAAIVLEAQVPQNTKTL